MYTSILFFNEVYYKRMRLPRQKNLEERYNLLILIVLLCVAGNIVLAGGLLNILAISTNGGKMPVYANDIQFETSKHFSFDEKNSVNNFILTDWIDIKFAWMSLGDIMIFIGVSFILGINSIILIRSLKGRRLWQKK